jgi:hypothetical protein
MTVNGAERKLGSEIGSFRFAPFAVLRGPYRATGSEGLRYIAKPMER